jgi:hypothetical protein
MLFSQHGTHVVHWQDQICVVIMHGPFNRRGIYDAVSSVQNAWRQAGCPARWALLYELRQWRGSTPEGLAEAQQFTEWAGQHGIAAVAKLVPNHFIVRLLNGQNLEYRPDTPMENFYDNQRALDWLSMQGFVTEHIPALLPAVQATTEQDEKL